MERDKESIGPLSLENSKNEDIEVISTSSVKEDTVMITVAESSEDELDQARIKKIILNYFIIWPVSCDYQMLTATSC